MNKENKYVRWFTNGPCVTVSIERSQICVEEDDKFQSEYYFIYIYNSIYNIFIVAAFISVISSLYLTLY